MSLRDFFTSRHTLWLEQEFEETKGRHLSAMKTLREQHEFELQYARSETERLQREIDRLRLYLTPALAANQQTSDESTLSTSGKTIYTGTPWQRVLAREIAEQDAEANRRITKPAEEEIPSTSN
jgi:hypothetical protein